MIRIGNFFFKYRDFLFPVTFLFLVFGTRPALFLGSEHADILLDIIGFLVALSGQILRAAVIGFAYIRRGGKNKRIYADSLVKEGFFAHSRNPLYLGNILILIGLGIIANSFWFYIIGMPFFIFAYLSIIMAEEDYLRKRFGDEYVEYCSRVNRFIPSFKGMDETLKGMSFNYKRLVSKEYGTTFTWIACAILLMIWERYSYFGFYARRDEIVDLSLLFIPLTIAYLTARYLKKTDRLRTD